MRFHLKLASTFIAVLSSILLASSANAHTDVVSTSPEDGAVIDVTPAEISITFSEPPISQGAAILLADVSGTELPLGEIQIEGAKVKAAAPADLLAGDYVVTWRVSAQDGHVITGEFSFTYTGKVAVTNPTNTVTAGTEEPIVAIPVSAEPAGESGCNLLVTAVAVFLVGAIVAAVLATRRRK
jgi:hypothetical protein